MYSPLYGNSCFGKIIKGEHEGREIMMSANVAFAYHQNDFVENKEYCLMLPNVNTNGYYLIPNVMSKGYL